MKEFFAKRRSVEELIIQAEEGSGTAMHLLWHRYFYARNFKEAKKWALRWSEKNPMMGEMYLGLTYLVQERYADARNAWEYGAANNNPFSHMFLANMYLHGRGVEKNLDVAESHYRVACELGSVPGCAALARVTMMKSGWNIRQRITGFNMLLRAVWDGFRIIKAEGKNSPKLRYRI